MQLSRLTIIILYGKKSLVDAFIAETRSRLNGMQNWPLSEVLREILRNLDLALRRLVREQQLSRLDSLYDSGYHTIAFSM